MIVYPNVKVNLGLNILRKRDDGFHDLETLFIPYFGFNDTLEIITGDEYSQTSAALFEKYHSGTSANPSEDSSANPSESSFRDSSRDFSEKTLKAAQLVQGLSEDGKLMITIARREGVDWNPLKDLCAKAYYLLAEDYDLPAVKIFLEKTSPVGAGLGGGSSDAAFTLLALNQMFELNIPTEKLAEYAARLGSDCAFFIYNKPMLASGRGEVLTPVQMINDLTGGDFEIKVLMPENINISTAEAYSKISPAIPEEHISEIVQKPIEQWKDLLVNDFEKSVFEAHPELAQIKQSLYDTAAVYASMSGSGPALFAIYRKN